MNPTELAVFGTLAGITITGAFTLITSFINKRSEERKQFKELIIKTAADNWQFVVEKSANPKHTPMPIHLIYMSKMFDLAFDKTVNPSNIKEKLTEISKLVEIMHNHTKEMSQPKTQ